MSPRRILLLVGSLLACAAAYLTYEEFFGWLDGLPLLPPRMLAASDGRFRPPPQATSPTLELLKLAFGENSPELESLHYPTQLRFLQGDKTHVLAAGSPPTNPNSNRVTLSPFSLAVISKPRPEHLRQPGELPEICTIHADRAVLEFDRLIQNPTDMNTARLVRLELISDPEQALPDALKRVGLVHITNNQRSADPNRHLVLKTVGPVFYRDPKYAVGPARLGPDIWTDAPIEVVDRGNLPRRSDGPVATAPSAAEELRNPAAIAAILEGQRLPPPTLTAVGLRVYLDASASPDRPPPPRRQAEDGWAGFPGVRRVELLEKVLMNLWLEGGQGLVSSARESSAAEPPGGAALAGGLLSAAHAARQLARELLQVQTRGPFYYDTEKNLARFDVLPLSDPHLPNDVQVTKVAARPGMQTLFSQVLEIEFTGAPVGAPPPSPGPPAPGGPGGPGNSGGPSSSARPGGPSHPGGPGSPGRDTPVPPGGGRIKRLHAWTYTPARFLTVASDTDQLEAYGQDLVHEQDTGRTLLTGAPLYAVRARNVLTAGGPKQSAVLILEPTATAGQSSGGSSGEKLTAGRSSGGSSGGSSGERSAPASSAAQPGRRTRATVRGPGRLELFDAASQANTAAVSWLASMVQTQERINDQELDLFTFTDGAKFEDTKADYWLKAKTLKLWLAPTGADGGSRPGSDVSRSLPHRIQAIGEVSGHSADLDIEQAELLNTFIRDVAPPATGAAAPSGPRAGDPGSPDRPNGPRGPTALREPVPPAAAADPLSSPPPPRSKPPVKLRARTVDTWVIRYPVPAAAGAVASLKPAVGQPLAEGQPLAGQPPPERTGGLKYQMEKARCEGMVSVHQEPADPTKPRGIDILGSVMLIDSTPEGDKLTVFGWENRPGEVHNEGTSLIGPEVVIDQVHNLASVRGRGSLVMPASSDFTGAELKKPEVLVVHFRDGMTFFGAKKVADFFGKVNAAQGSSWVTCHTLRVNFDRPVYFTPVNRPGGVPRPVGSPAMPTAPGTPATLTASGTPGTPATPGTPGTPAAPTAAGDDRPRVDKIYCYPAPADTADSPQEKLVWFTQVDRDPQTGRPVRQQKLVARELRLEAQARDPNGGEPYRLVFAEGPGVTRTWQVGSGDEDAAARASAAADPKPPGSSDAGQMKLTVVNFSGRMTVKDKGRAYQEATFHDPVQVIQVPTDNPELEVDRHKLPPRAMLLTCADKLVLWSHRTADQPPRQHMIAYGNAFVQNDEYDGWGDTITYEGRQVILDGTGAVPARIKGRFKGNDQAGQRIIFDRATNHYTVEGSLGGTIFSTPAGTPKSGNPPTPQPPPRQQP